MRLKLLRCCPDFNVSGSAYFPLASKPINQDRRMPYGNDIAPVSIMDPPYDIQERTFVFAVQVANFCRELIAAHPVTRRLSWQLLDAATSIGANMEEADAGQSKRDFISKTAVARKELASLSTGCGSFPRPTRDADLLFHRSSRRANRLRRSSQPSIETLSATRTRTASIPHSAFAIPHSAFRQLPVTRSTTPTVEASCPAAGAT